MVGDSSGRVSAIRGCGRKRAFPTSSRRAWKVVTAVTLSASFVSTIAFQHINPFSHHNSPVLVSRSSTARYVLADPRNLLKIESSQSVEDRAALEELYLLSSLAKKATRKNSSEKSKSDVEAGLAAPIVESENDIGTIKQEPESISKHKFTRTSRTKTIKDVRPTTRMYEESPTHTPLDIAETSAPKASKKVEFKGLTTIPNVRNMKKKLPLVGTLAERLAVSEDEHIRRILQKKEDQLLFEPKQESNEKTSNEEVFDAQIGEISLLSNILEVEAQISSELPKGPTIVRSSRSSYFPGLNERTSSERYKLQEEARKLAERNPHMEYVATPKKEEAAIGGQSMYKTSKAVPESLVHFANEIHRVERITPEEEMQLGEKTQEALRVQKIYDGLKTKLRREPTDDEWCAASGKFNMEAVTQIIDEGLEAKNKLVTSNLRMVQGVVNVYIRNGMNGEYNAGDMMQEGIVALIRAAEKFDPKKGFRFSTYAMYWIRAAMKRDHCDQSRIIKVPQRLHESNKKVKEVKQQLWKELDRAPTAVEVSERAGLSLEQLERVEEAFAQKVFSLDQKLRNRHAKDIEGNGKTNLECITSNSLDRGGFVEGDVANLRRDLFKAMSDHLTEEESTVLKLKFGLDDKYISARKNGPTMIEVGQIMGFSTTKTKRIFDQSLTKLEREVGDSLRHYKSDFCV